MEKQIETMTQKIHEIARQLTDLTKLALNMDLSGDELDKLYNLRHRIDLSLYKYLDTYSEMLYEREKRMAKWNQYRLAECGA